MVLNRIGLSPSLLPSLGSSRTSLCHLRVGLPLAHLRCRFSTATPDTKPTLFGRIVGYAKKSRDFVKQYYNGSRVLMRESKLAGELRKKRDRQGYQLTRAEHVLVHKSAMDVRKTIPFFITLVVLPESLPFLMVYQPHFFPSTCLSAEQWITKWTNLAKIRTKFAQEATSAARDGGAVMPERFLSDSECAAIARSQSNYFIAENMSRQQLAVYNRFMGLPRFGLRSTLKKALKSHFKYLREDDLLIQKEGIDSLSDPQVQTALEERGINSLGQSPEERRRSLQAWIKLHLHPDPHIPEGMMILAVMFRSHICGRIESAN
ncbi:LETM1-like protein-domain-containing protein [Polychytrium aggregatum]|uniref:LETM1-like protein-domain-containing protein n=1 Tax=Polychytrium aggregatum TaxID=110093 RepID=UPI0022FE7B69|nr:LETM1-like protein-domain-containing protein [Polychytrium aggregatum]KAI9209310.1 LETM1-like protein-domain-containing protein [Polychytrium aggregatum]